MLQTVDSYSILILCLSGKKRKEKKGGYIKWHSWSNSPVTFYSVFFLIIVKHLKFPWMLNIILLILLLRVKPCTC